VCGGKAVLGWAAVRVSVARQMRPTLLKRGIPTSGSQEGGWGPAEVPIGCAASGSRTLSA
jgi:hypothetical protein